MVGSFVRFFFTRCEESLNSFVRCAHSFVRASRNSWRKIVCTHQPWSNLYVSSPRTIFFVTFTAWIFQKLGNSPPPSIPNSTFHFTKDGAFYLKEKQSIRTTIELSATNIFCLATELRKKSVMLWETRCCSSLATQYHVETQEKLRVLIFNIVWLGRWTSCIRVWRVYQSA